MSRFTDDFLAANDIDWYCSLFGRPIHIATKGVLMPRPIRDINELRERQIELLDLPYICDAEVNVRLIRDFTVGRYDYVYEFDLQRDIEVIFADRPSFNYNRELNVVDRLFSHRYIERARKGFYSYSRIYGTNDFFLVASPVDCREFPRIGKLEPIDRFFVKQCWLNFEREGIDNNLIRRLLDNRMPEIIRL